MEIATKRIIYKSRTDEFEIWGLACLHVGAAATDEDAIRDTVSRIKRNPKAMFVSLGDLAEFIPRKDWRNRTSQMARWLRDLEPDYCDDIVQSEIDKLVEILSPIKNKCLGAISGNHEDKLLDNFERDAHRELCRRLQWVNLSDEGWIRLKFQRGENGPTRNFDIYATHSHISGRTDGAIMGAMRRLLGGNLADLILVAHGHKRVILPVEPKMGLNDIDELTAHRCYALMCGTFHKSHAIGTSSYASKAGYPATDIGAMCAKYSPDKDEIRAEL